MSISCKSADLVSNIAQAGRPEPTVSGARQVPFDRGAPALARRHRIARGDLAERGRSTDLPPDGSAVPNGAYAELRRGGRAGRGSRRGDQGPARGARPGRVVPARGRGVPRPHAPPSLTVPRPTWRARAHARAGARKSGRSWIRTRDLRLIRAAL